MKEKNSPSHRIVSIIDGQTQLPTHIQEFRDCQALVLTTKNGYKLLPLVPDVEKVYIEVTAHCNFRCTTCIHNTWDENNPRAMTEDQFETLFASLKKLPNLKTIHIGGYGEPLTHPRIIPFLQQLRTLPVRLEMVTNGSLLDEKMREALVNLPLDTLYVSLDAPTPAEYETIRQGGNLSGVLGNLKELMACKQAHHSGDPEVNILFVAMQQNVHLMPEMAKLLKPIGARRLFISNLLPCHPSQKDQILYDYDDSIVAKDPEIGQLMYRAQLPQMKLRTQRYCRYVEDKALAINYLGEVCPCYGLLHTYSCFIYGKAKTIRKKTFGNAFEQTLADIWTNPDYVYFRSKVKDFDFPSCTDCKYREGCNMAEDNDCDCWGNSPSCADCLWARGIIYCP